MSNNQEESKKPYVVEIQFIIHVDATDSLDAEQKAKDLVMECKPITAGLDYEGPDNVSVTTTVLDYNKDIKPNIKNPTWLEQVKENDRRLQEYQKEKQAKLFEDKEMK